MIRLVNLVPGLVLVGAIAAGVASAKEIKKEVTFSHPVVVNGTLVKEGTYEVVFDDQTNEVTIVKGRKIIARAPARLEKREERTHATYVTRQEDNSTNAVLLSVGLKGNNQVTIANSGDSAQ